MKSGKSDFRAALTSPRLTTRDPRPSRYAAYETGGAAQNVQHPLFHGSGSTAHQNRMVSMLSKVDKTVSLVANGASLP